MGFSAIHHRFVADRRVQAGIQNVSRILKPCGRAANDRRAIAAALMISSVGLGVWAYRLSELDALSAWKTSHAPSAGAWAHALGSRAFLEIRDGKPFARALRTLPASVDGAGSVWVGEDSLW